MVQEIANYTEIEKLKWDLIPLSGNRFVRIPFRHQHGKIYCTKKGDNGRFILVFVVSNDVIGDVRRYFICDYTDDFPSAIRTMTDGDIDEAGSRKVAKLIIEALN